MALPRLQTSEQYFTSAQFFAQRRRQVIASPQAAQGLLGSAALLPLKLALGRVTKVPGRSMPIGNNASTPDRVRIPVQLGDPNAGRLFRVGAGYQSPKKSFVNPNRLSSGPIC